MEHDRELAAAQPPNRICAKMQLVETFGHHSSEGWRPQARQAYAKLTDV